MCGWSTSPSRWRSRSAAAPRRPALGARLGLHTATSSPVSQAPPQARDDSWYYKPQQETAAPKPNPRLIAQQRAMFRGQQRDARLASMEAELDTARRTLNERKVIERAKGVLMSRMGLTEEAAFRWVNGWPDALEPALWIFQLAGVLVVPLVLAGVAWWSGRHRLAWVLAAIVPADAGSDSATDSGNASDGAVGADAAP